MSFPVSSIYAAVLAGLLILLSLRVICRRWRDGRAWGDGGAGPLRERIRAQGNFTEYVPMALILLVLAEARGAPPAALHLVGGSLLLGRLIHAAALTERPDVLRWRVLGMVLTFTALGTGAVLLLLPAIGD